MKTKLSLLAVAAATSLAATAQMNLRPVLYVNADVTTHIIMPEQLKMVDISTENVVGDQCTDNMVRIKPVVPDSAMNTKFYFHPGQFLATITLIGERHMSQYDLVYDDRPEKAEAMYKVRYDDGCSYSNPEIAMPESEMANYAWAISNTKRKYNCVRSNAYGIAASVFNIYSIGNYFFIDLYLKNKTNIKYDIAQMRVSLTDKKETKATNSQTLELTPAFVLNNAPSFKKDYRQVIVLEKLTFPEEKVLNIEISEDQISGRVITIPIEYEDILNADGFDCTKIDAYYKVADQNNEMNKEIKRLTKVLRTKQEELERGNKNIASLKKQNDIDAENLKRRVKDIMTMDEEIVELKKSLAEKQRLLDRANKEIDELNGELQKSSNQYLKISKKLESMRKLSRKLKELDLDIDEIENSEDDGSIYTPSFINSRSTFNAELK